VGEGLRQLISRFYPDIATPPKSTSEAMAEQLKQGAAGAVSEGVLSPVISTVFRAVAPLIKRSAARGIRAVMDPTGAQAEGEAIRASEKILERGGYVSPTRSSLERKAESEIERLSPQTGLIAAEEALIKNQNIALRPIITGLNDLKRALHMPPVPTVAGGTQTTKLYADAQIKAIDEVIGHIQANSMNGTFIPGRTISRESLRLVRQVLDDTIKDAFAVSARGEAGSLVELGRITKTQKNMSNVLRTVLNRDAPDIAELNAEFSLWKSVKDAMSPTSLRAEFPKEESIWTRMWHTRYAMWLAGAGAAGGGYHVGGGIGAATAVGALVAVNQLMKSTAWRTVSAAAKSRIADGLARGSYEETAMFVSRLMISGNTAPPPETKKRE